MQLQDNLMVEGKIQTNQTIEALNTTIFEDIGSGNTIKINIKGNVNLNQKDLIKDYSQLLNIPIKIRKKGTFNPSSALKISVGNLVAITCIREMNGLTDDMNGISLVDGDIITAIYNGTNFIISGDKFLSGIYVTKNYLQDYTVDGGYFIDIHKAVTVHNITPTTHTNMIVDGGKTEIVSGNIITLEEHVIDQTAHQNLIVDGNNLGK